METAIYADSRKRTEITVETHSVTTIRTIAGSIDLVECVQCGRDVRRLSDVAASVIFGVEPAEIERLADANDIHRIAETDVCGLSLVIHFGSDIRFIENTVDSLAIKDADFCKE